MEKNLEKLSKILSVFDSESLSQDDFVKHFEVIVEFVKQTRDLTEEELKNLRSMFLDAMDELKTTNTEKFETFKARLLAEIEPKLAGFKDGYTPIKGKDYFDGKDADEEIIIERILESIKEKDKTPHQEAIEVRDALESLKKGEKLSIQAIEDLPEILDELRKKKKGGVLVGGGGMNAIPMHFVDDETPAGTINGSNTDFTVNLPPATGSLKVYRGGARQRITEDYTLSGQTITFLIAPQVGEVILVDYRT